VAVPGDGVHTASLARLVNAYGSDTNGIDGGTFVELVELPNGENNVPHEQFLGDICSPTMPEFSDVWFQNKGKANHVHVIGAEYRERVDDGMLGPAYANGNVQCTYLKAIARCFPYDIATVNADCTAHEMGHQLELGQVDDGHPAGVLCHLGPGTD